MCFDEKDSTHTVLNHLGDHVPDSIRKEAMKELERRGLSKNQIQHEDWKRTD